MPLILWMNFSHVQMICIANLYDCCKCIIYTALYLYICMFYDMFHILLSCESQGSIKCVLYCIDVNKFSIIEPMFRQWVLTNLRYFLLFPELRIVWCPRVRELRCSEEGVILHILFKVANTPAKEICLMNIKFTQSSLLHKKIKITFPQRNAFAETNINYRKPYNICPHKWLYSCFMLLAGLRIRH